MALYAVVVQGAVVPQSKAPHEARLTHDAANPRCAHSSRLSLEPNGRQRHRSYDSHNRRSGETLGAAMALSGAVDYFYRRDLFTGGEAKHEHHFWPGVVLFALGVLFFVSAAIT